MERWAHEACTIILRGRPACESRCRLGALCAVPCGDRLMIKVGYECSRRGRVGRTCSPAQDSSYKV